MDDDLEDIFEHELLSGYLNLRCKFFGSESLAWVLEDNMPPQNPIFTNYMNRHNLYEDLIKCEEESNVEDISQEVAHDENVQQPEVLVISDDGDSEQAPQNCRKRARIQYTDEIDNEVEVGPRKRLRLAHPPQQQIPAGRKQRAPVATKKQKATAATVEKDGKVQCNVCLYRNKDMLSHLKSYHCMEYTLAQTTRFCQPWSTGLAGLEDRVGQNGNLRGNFLEKLVATDLGLVREEVWRMIRLQPNRAVPEDNMTIWEGDAANVGPLGAATMEALLRVSPNEPVKGPAESLLYPALVKRLQTVQGQLQHQDGAVDYTHGLRKLLDFTKAKICRTVIGKRRFQCCQELVDTFERNVAMTSQNLISNCSIALHDLRHQCE